LKAGSDGREIETGHALIEYLLVNMRAWASIVWYAVATNTRPQSFVVLTHHCLPVAELSGRASHRDTALLLSLGWPSGIYW